MARELRLGVFADAALRAGDGNGGVGEGGVLLERRGVYGRRRGAALCVRPHCVYGSGVFL